MEIEPIVINELRDALNSAKNRKAAWPGDITIDLFKNGPDLLNWTVKAYDPFP